MQNNKPLVSIIIPTRNSALYLGNCLHSIKSQTYKNIETIIVDGSSTDNILEIIKKYEVRYLNFSPKVKKGKFDAPQKRNFGVSKSKGKFVYYVDADMELSKNLVSEAVRLCSSTYDGLIIAEDSFGKGIWASAKNLERKCYWGDDKIEAPRFFKKKVWEKLGGLDESLGGGGDDWDLYQKALNDGFKIGRTKNIIRHNEGDLKLMNLFKKRFKYGRDSVKYISKRPKEGISSYFPIRKAYIKNWRLFLGRPIDSIAFVVMRTIEYAAGLSGILYSLIKR